MNKQTNFLFYVVSIDAVEPTIVSKQAKDFPFLRQLFSGCKLSLRSRIEMCFVYT